MRLSPEQRRFAISTLTPFGQWLYTLVYRKRVSPVGAMRAERGIYIGPLPLVAVMAEPYDDTLLLPFMVTHWSMAVKVLGVAVLRWHRQTGLRRYKHRHRGWYAGRSQENPQDWGLA